MDTQQIALDLLKIRLQAYWSIPGNISNRPGDVAVKEWFEDCLKMAQIITKSNL